MWIASALADGMRLLSKTVAPYFMFNRTQEKLFEVLKAKENGFFSTLQDFDLENSSDAVSEKGESTHGRYE